MVNMGGGGKGEREGGGVIYCEWVWACLSMKGFVHYNRAGSICAFAPKNFGIMAACSHR